MSVMIAAKAASSTEGANHDIMSVSEPEACMHGYGERRMAIMNEVHDIITSKNGLCSVFAILSFSLRICMVLDTLAN